MEQHHRIGPPVGPDHTRDERAADGDEHWDGAPESPSAAPRPRRAGPRRTTDVRDSGARSRGEPFFRPEDVAPAARRPPVLPGPRWRPQPGRPTQEVEKRSEVNDDAPYVPGGTYPLPG